MNMRHSPIRADQRLSPDLLGPLELLLTQFAAPPSGRTARLLRASTAKKARKLVEEATEVALDAVAGNREGLIAESVDLLYHLAVLWHDRGITPQEVRAEMARRMAVLGIVEKRPKKGAAKRALAALEAGSPSDHADQPQTRARACALYRDGNTIGRVRMSDLHPGAGLS